jgi:hypothetical protein
MNDVIGIVLVVVVSIAGLAAITIMEKLHARERDAWAQERRALLDRAIARHTGEVLALDRQASPRPKPDRDPILVEGLN